VSIATGVSLNNINARYDERVLTSHSGDSLLKTKALRQVRQQT
jgi:hypothetical protein